jgi:hypothetical protein
LTSIAGETSSLGLRPAFAIAGNFVGDEISDRWPSLAISEGRDVKKELRGTPIVRNEAEASIVLPFDNTPLEAHAFPCALTFALCRAVEGAGAPPAGVGHQRAVRWLTVA